MFDTDDAIAISAFESMLVLNEAPSNFRSVCAGDDLGAVYGSCSEAKRRAWRYCCNLCYALNHHAYACEDGNLPWIHGYNCMMFSVEFDFYSPIDGRPMHAFITRRYNRCWPRA